MGCPQLDRGALFERVVVTVLMSRLHATEPVGLQMCPHVARHAQARQHGLRSPAQVAHFETLSSLLSLHHVRRDVTDESRERSRMHRLAPVGAEKRGFRNAADFMQPMLEDCCGRRRERDEMPPRLSPRSSRVVEDHNGGINIDIGGSGAQQLRRALTSEKKAELHRISLRARPARIESPDKGSKLGTAQHSVPGTIELRQSADARDGV